MTSFILADSSKVLLPLNMTSRDFAQARLTSYIEEIGYVVNRSSDGWTFTPWKFEDTSEIDDLMYVSGPGFEGKMLLESLVNLEKINEDDEKCNKDHEALRKSFLPQPELINSEYAEEWQKKASSYKSTVSLIATLQTVLKFAADTGVNLPFISPAQVLCNIKNDVCDSFLFLPPTLVDRAAAAKKDREYSKFIGCWIRPGLYDNEAVKFTLTACLYVAATGIMAFPNRNTEKRSQDNVDKYFVPVNCLITGISDENAIIINGNLSGKKPLRNLPDILPMMENTPIFSGKSPEQVELEKFTEKSNKKVEFLTKRIKAKRWIRKHSSGISFILIFAVIMIAIISSLFNNKKDVPSTKGLTSRQTVEAFYTAYNHLYTEQISACATKKAGGNYSSVVSAMYVNGKMRESYESLKQLTPAQWMYSYGSGYTKNIVFGITDFMIDGEYANSSFNCPIRRENVPALTEEDGIPLANGDKKQYEVTFFVYTPDAENTFEIQLYTDIVTVTYKKDKWLITNIIQSPVELSIDTEAFLSDYNSFFPKELRDYNSETNTATIARTDMNTVALLVPEFVESFRETYKWLPRNDEMDNAKKEIAGAYGVPEE